jgi:hypothetical protein
MRLDIYASLDGSYSFFDGHRAWLHLTIGLGMIPQEVHEIPEAVPLFSEFLRRYAGNITVHPSGPVLLLAPSWFA